MEHLVIQYSVLNYQVRLFRSVFDKFMAKLTNIYRVVQKAVPLF